MSINVIPGTGNDVLPVATSEIGGVHYPIYKMAYGSDGEVVLIDTDTAMPVTGDIVISQSEVAAAQQNEIVQAIKALEKQMKIMNIHLSMMTDNEISKAEID